MIFVFLACLSAASPLSKLKSLGSKLPGGGQQAPNSNPYSGGVGSSSGVTGGGGGGSSSSSGGGGGSSGGGSASFGGPLTANGNLASYGLNPPGYDTEGSFGPGFEHHNAHHTSPADTGKQHVLFTDDILHHSDGGVYINMGDEHPYGIPNTLSVNDIHHRMNDAIADAHNASIAGKEAARKAEMIRASIAAERAHQKEEEVAMLKELDDEAVKKELDHPEVLGKVTIPVATFTQESFPLFHHVRALLAKIRAIQNTEQNAIKAQQTITRLDDITDQMKLQDVGVQNPAAYHSFMAAGGANNFLLDVPVVDHSGAFYISNSSADGNGRDHCVPLRENVYADGHSHYKNHGDVTIGKLANSARSIM